MQLRRRSRLESSAEEGELLEDDDSEGRLLDFYDEEAYPLYTHVDKLVKTIAKGGYVELTKLLLDQRPEETREMIDFAKKSGMSFLVPSIKAKMSGEKTIESLTVWSQAFKVYHSIYTSFHPDMSGELLQHEHNVADAAKTFPWAHVLTYDEKFRRHMEVHLNCNWGRLHQMLYLAELHRGGGNKKEGEPGKPGTSRETLPCRHFNAKNDCPFGAEKCRYDHRCSFCGMKGHGYFNCFKRMNRDKKKKGKEGAGGSLQRGNPGKTPGANS